MEALFKPPTCGQYSKYHGTTLQKRHNFVGLIFLVFYNDLLINRSNELCRLIRGRTAMKSNERDSSECFRPLAGMQMVYEPGWGKTKIASKHPCSDCYFCQHCGDDRCSACRGKRSESPGSLCRKLSVKDQILLYERINAQGRQDGNTRGKDSQHTWK